MRLAGKTLIVGCVLAAGLSARVEGQVARKGGSAPSPSFTRITLQEIVLLLKDLAELNPMALKRMEEEPELKRTQLENLRQLLAFASEAQRTGLAADPHYRNELRYIRIETIAINYDRYINKGKDALPPFGHITDAAVARYRGEGAGALSAAMKAQRKAKLEEFIE